MVSERIPDAGYVTSDTEASGTSIQQVTTYTRDPTSNLIVSSKDALNRMTSYGYDSLGNLKSVTLLSGTINAVTYQYTYTPQFNELATATDPLNHTTQFGYDGFGDLTTVTDPLGHGVATITYNTGTGLPTQITDALGHSTMLGYTGSDLTSVTDALGRTSTRYVDSIGRVITMTDPLGNQSAYAYDPMNRVTSITDALGEITSLTYGYDNDGRINARGGSLDVTNLPAVLASASYDADGNLTGDGTNTYTWNTRNQLLSLSGGSTASFVYDGLGRRETKTIASTSTNFLYDGLNLEQELSGTTPTVNYLTGENIDETFSRTDSSGNYSYLTDIVGSTLALANTSGSLTTHYNYDPYGNTTQTGSASTNALQYTGRENDGTGLYYYRARYYSPTYGRFISSDPLGLRGGPNVYGYALQDPIFWSDPYGLFCLSGALRGAFIGGISGALGGAVNGLITGGLAGAGFGLIAGGAFGALGGALNEEDKAGGFLLGAAGAAATGIAGQNGLGGITGGAIGGVVGGPVGGGFGGMIGGFLDAEAGMEGEQTAIGGVGGFAGGVVTSLTEWGLNSLVPECSQRSNCGQ